MADIAYMSVSLHDDDANLPGEDEVDGDEESLWRVEDNEERAGDGVRHEYGHQTEHPGGPDQDKQLDEVLKLTSAHIRRQLAVADDTRD